MRNKAFQSIATLVLVLFAQAALASSVVRSYTPRYSTTTRGELVLIGNANMSCLNGAANCAAARNGTAAANNNNDYNMAYQNTDGVPTIPANSSTATLTIPAGSTVLFAGLYWGADTSAGTGGSAAPSAAGRDIVRFATPASAYAGVSAEQLDVSGTRYAGFADVTARVQTGGSGTYKVSGIQAGTGGDRYAGWALVVVLGNESLPPRNMVVFDGYAIINSTAPTSVTTAVSGFLTPPTGPVNTQMGFVAFEGDLSSGGDRFRLNTTDLTNTANPADNAFNSTISALGTNVVTRNPNFLNNFGFDIDLFATNVLGNNASSANLTFTTGGETYFPSVLTFQTDVFEPVIVTNFTKSATDANGAPFRPGDEVTYSVSVANTGNDDAEIVVITDPLPASVTFVPGSIVVTNGPNAGPKTDAAGDDQVEFNGSQIVFRAGVGANSTAGGVLTPSPTPTPTSATTIEFKVTINADVANGTAISNVASIGYRSSTTGIPGTGSTPPASFNVVNEANLQITKTNKPAEGPADGSADTVAAGSSVDYSIVVTNLGPSAANGAVVRDPASTGLTCTTAVCGSATNGAVCPGATGAALVSELQSAAGTVIPTMPVNGAVTFTLTCGVAP